MVPPTLIDPIVLDGYKAEIHSSFSDLADYIWKLPRFLDAERELEAKKLWDYFPKQADPEEEERASQLRKWRAHHEFGKILIEFPHYIATSNLFLACSVFERHLFRLCRAVHLSLASTEIGLTARGVSGLLKYLKLRSIKTDDMPYSEQVGCAMELRNCLLHADGNLAYARNGVRIRQIVEHRLYLDKLLRDRHTRMNVARRVVINTHEGGEFLVVDNLYSHLICSRFREFLIQVCDRVPCPDDYD